MAIVKLCAEHKTPVVAFGTGTSLATVTIRSQISGYLLKIDFKEGDEVKKGDLLAEIDSRPYEAALNQAKGALARDEACYVGQPIAVVIADSRYLAEDAAAAVAVDYDVLAAAGDCRAAIKDGAPRAHSDLASNVIARFPLAYGDVDAAFANAAHVFEEVLWQHRGGGMALETRAVLATHDPVADTLTVWSGTQTPHLGRGTLPICSIAILNQSA